MKLIATGGHLSPLLAVLEALPKSTSVLVIGRNRALEGDLALSLESEVLSKRGIPFASITTGRWQRKWTRHTFFSFLKFFYGFFQAFRIFWNYKPNIVLSFGGYVSLPVTLTAFVLRIPVVIHEQTLEAGLANRIAGMFAKKICISWESSRKFFPKSKTILTGNPVRKFPISNFQFPISNEKLSLIYITGGSLGSHAINVLIEGILEKLLTNHRIIHQTGDAREFNDFARLENLKKSLSPKLQDRYFLTKFVDPKDVGSILNSADLVISRCGMNTLTELIYFQKPSFLIPLIFSGRDEQVKNAKFLKNLGLSKIAFQDNLTSARLYELIVGMMKNLKQYQNYKIGNLIKKDAAQKIIEICLKES